MIIWYTKYAQTSKHARFISDFNFNEKKEYVCKYFMLYLQNSRIIFVLW